jgi:hypothetical protein
MEKERLFAVEDPAMPRCVRPMARRAWATLAPHLRDEFMAIVEGNMGLRQYEDRQKRGAGAAGRGLAETLAETHAGWSGCGGRARAAVLYALLPYDKTSWGAALSPGWWAIKASMAVTFLGISSLSFAAVLAVIDRGDSFQLVHYVFLFKQFQFWVSGVLGLVMVAADYSYCIIVMAPERSAECGASGTHRHAPSPPTHTLWAVELNSCRLVSTLYQAPGRARCSSSGPPWSLP